VSDGPLTYYHISGPSMLTKYPSEVKATFIPPRYALYLRRLIKRGTDPEQCPAIRGYSIMGTE